MMEAQHHYVSQLIKQLYVLVLGLDVLGNPFGLVSGFKQGVEDLFYEPFQVYNFIITKIKIIFKFKSMSVQYLFSLSNSHTINQIYIHQN